MLGTDLFQAYESEQPPPISGRGGMEPVYEENKSSNQKPPATNLVPPMSESKSAIFYDQDSYIKEAQLQQQIQNLQNQLRKENTNGERGRQDNNTPSLIDLFVSKKKDVIKLAILSLTVLLGLSLHYVASDMIRNYLADNDFTPNQECMTKVAYPLTVILTIWALKVYNR